jgi:hypothetical protein
MNTVPSPLRASELQAGEDSFEALENQIAALSGHIEGLQAQLRRLYTRRNAHVPLCRLPADVLLRILDVMAESELTPVASGNIKSRRHPDRRSSEWTRLANVCTHTRTLALETPSVWTCIDLNRLRWANLCVSRAAGAALNICYRGESHWNQNGRVLRRQELLKVLPAAQHATLEINTGPYARNNSEEIKALEALDAGFNQPLPALRSLDLSFYRFKMSSNFLGGTSSLRSLTLRGFSLYEVKIMLPQLTYIALHEVKCGHALLFDFLERAPHLQHVHVEALDVRHGDDFDLPVRAVNLPHLRILHLEADIELIAFCAHAWPTPKHRLWLGVICGPRGRSDEVAQPTRTQMLTWVSSLGEETCAADLVLRHRPHMDDLHVLKIRIRGLSTPNIVLEDRCVDFRSLDYALVHLHKLRVTGREVKRLFAHVAKPETAHLLDSVTHLMIDNPPHHSKELEDWLSARTTTGPCVEILEFDFRWKPHLESGQTLPPKPETVAEMKQHAARLGEMGLASSVLIDGCPI